MARKTGLVLSSKEEHRKEIEAEKLKILTAQSSTYKRRQNAVFTLLDMPQTKVAYAYHTVNLSLIFGSMVISVLSTVEYFSNSENFTRFILYYEVSLLVWFTIEYVLRFWSCIVVGKWKGWWGRFRFMRSFYMLVDAFVIGTTLTTIILQMKNSYFIVLRITRFLQVFRVLRLDRQRGDLRTMGHVVYQHKKELVTCYFVGFIILFSGTYVIYIVEDKTSNETPTIDNMASGMYWAMITVTSVGYGDISPITWAGKLCTGIFALVGCAFFALPAGILGSGFALQVAKQKKDRRYMKIKNPAAVVIQSLWRNHSVKRNQYHIQGTWAYLFPQTMRSISRRAYYNLLPGVRPIHDSAYFDLFRASLGRKKTDRKAAVKVKVERIRKLSSIGPFSTRSSIMSRKESTTSTRRQSQPESRRESAVSTHHKTDPSSSQPESRVGSRRGSQSTLNQFVPGKRKKEKVPLAQLISGRYKAATQFVLRVKFFTDVRKFKSERYPFVNVSDVMEKNSHHHLETIGHLKDIDRYIDVFQAELDLMKVKLGKNGIVWDSTCEGSHDVKSKSKNKSKRGQYYSNTY